MPGQAINPVAYENLSYIATGISTNGRYITYTSTINPDHMGQRLEVPHIFVKDIQGGGTYDAETLWEANYDGGLSGDGQWFAYTSYAQALSPPVSEWVSNFTPNQILMKNWQTGMRILVSGSATGNAGNGPNGQPSVSGDGKLVAFSSLSDNLFANDVNQASDIFVKNVETGQMQLVSSSNAGVQGNGFSDVAKISGDGRYVAFISNANNLIPGLTTSQTNVYVKDLLTGALNIATYDTPSTTLYAISGDGRHVVYATYERTGLQDEYLLLKKDMLTGQVVNIASNASGLSSHDYHGEVSISDDGRYVAFASRSDNLFADDHNQVQDVYVKDTQTGALGRVVPDNVESHSHFFNTKLAGDGQSMVFFGSVNNPSATQLVLWQTAVPAMQGNEGNDTLQLDHTSRSTIDGGAGLDTASYRGAKSSYAVVNENGALHVSAVMPSGGLDYNNADTLYGVERLKFDDVSVAYDINGNAGQSYRLYQAAFNHVPDQTGLAYWMDVMDHGTSLLDVAQSFMQSAEFIDLYATAMTAEDFIARLYENVLHRPMENEGHQYWRGILDQNQASPAQLLVYFSESAENRAALIGSIAYGIDYMPLA